MTYILKQTSQHIFTVLCLDSSVSFCSCWSLICLLISRLVSGLSQSDVSTPISASTLSTFSGSCLTADSSDGLTRAISYSILYRLMPLMNISKQADISQNTKTIIRFMELLIFVTSATLTLLINHNTCFHFHHNKSICNQVHYYLPQMIEESSFPT